MMRRRASKKIAADETKRPASISRPKLKTNFENEKKHPDARMTHF